jgi:hypothetical protein
METIERVIENKQVKFGNITSVLLSKFGEAIDSKINRGVSLLQIVKDMEALQVKVDIGDEVKEEPEVPVASGTAEAIGVGVVTVANNSKNLDVTVKDNLSGKIKGKRGRQPNVKKREMVSTFIKKLTDDGKSQKEVIDALKKKLGGSYQNAYYYFQQSKK